MSHIVQQHQGGAVGPAFQGVSEGIVVHIADSGFRHVGTAVEAFAHGGIKGVVFLLDHGGAGGTGEAVGSVAVVGDLVGVHRVVALDQGQGAVLVLVDPVTQNLGLELCCIQFHAIAGDGEDAVVGFDVGCSHVNRPDLAVAGVGVQDHGNDLHKHTVLIFAGKHRIARNIQRTKLEEAVHQRINGHISRNVHCTENRVQNHSITDQGTAGNIGRTIVRYQGMTRVVFPPQGSAGHIHLTILIDHDHSIATFGKYRTAHHIQGTENSELRMIDHPTGLAVTAVLNGQLAADTCFIADLEVFNFTFGMHRNRIAIQIQGNRLIGDGNHRIPSHHIIQQHQGGAVGPAFQGVSEGIVVHIADSGFRHVGTAVEAFAHGGIKGVVFLLDHGGAGGTGEAVGSVAVVGDLVGVHRVVALDQGQGAVLVLVDPVAQNLGLELCCIQNHAIAGDGEEAVVVGDACYGHENHPDLAFIGLGIQGNWVVGIELRHHYLTEEYGTAGDVRRAAECMDGMLSAADSGTAGDIHYTKVIQRQIGFISAIHSAAGNVEYAPVFDQE